MDNTDREEITQAFLAVRTHVLPGLLDAWDEAGPAVVLVLTGIMADAWLSTGRETFDLMEMIGAMQRVDGAVQVK